MINKTVLYSIKALAISLLFVSMGCHTTPKAPKYSQALGAIKLDDPALADLKATPIIDIHTHNFNARDIPLEGIILGRRDARPPWTWFISDDLSKFIAAVVVADTSPESLPERAVHTSKTRVERVTETAKDWNLKRNTREAITNQDHYQAIRKAIDYQRKHEYSDLTPGQKMALRSVAALFGHKEHSFRTPVRKTLDDISPFLGDLTLADDELLKQFFVENGDDVQFRVAHMMDMAPTYDQKPNWHGMRPFKKEIERLEELQSLPNAHMAYFVAYNPFRDNIRPGDSLSMVQNAIRSNHAYGVKIYPPAGYRAISNSIPRRPFALFTSYPGKQWDGRYKRDGKKISNAELDDRVLELLCWCASNDIPVFAHSGYGEFQARSGYGRDMPNPRWWGYVLTNASATHPELKQLRLCFAHAGGADEFFGDTSYKSWSHEVWELCTHCANVYCEFGCQDSILDTNKQAVFAMNMNELCHKATDAEHPYSFASKIMYGSDWYMPISGGTHLQFKEHYQQVFLLPELREFYRPFFLSNALNYLNAQGRLSDPQFPLDRQVASQLRSLLAKAGH